MIFATDLQEPEGPVCLPDRSFLLVETGPGSGQVVKITSDGREKQILARTGRPNGLALDRNNYIWIAESSTPTLLRMHLNGNYEVWLSGCDGNSFIFPNDLCFGPDGWLYMTDSGISIHDFIIGSKSLDNLSKLKVDGRVYRISTKTKEITQLDGGLLFPNGIAFGPDNNLYVNETLTGIVYKYSIDANGIGPRQCFGNVNDSLGSRKITGPDGMKFDQEGKLYIAVYGEQNVTVLERDGQICKQIKTTGKQPSNLVFGPFGDKTLFVTECQYGAIEYFNVDTNGYQLYS